MDAAARREARERRNNAILIAAAFAGKIDEVAPLPKPAPSQSEQAEFVSDRWW